MIRGGRLGRSIRTEDYRYTEWRLKNNKLVEKELYDHRNDTEEGCLEKVNVVDRPEYADVAHSLSVKLHRIILHEKP